MDSDHDKIIRTEEKVDALSDIVYEIRDNHLFHLKQNVDKLTDSFNSINVKLALWSGGIIASIWFIEKFLQ